MGRDDRELFVPGKKVLGTAPPQNAFLREYEATIASAGILGVEKEFKLAMRYEMERMVERPGQPCKPRDVLRLVNQAIQKSGVRL